MPSASVRAREDDHMVEAASHDMALPPIMACSDFDPPAKSRS
jgi:hypothetical protein